MKITKRLALSHTVTRSESITVSMHLLQINNTSNTYLMIWNRVKNCMVDPRSSRAGQERAVRGDSVTGRLDPGRLGPGRRRIWGSGR